MTSKVLTKPMLHNMMQNIRANRKTTIIIAIMHMLAVPLILANCMFNFAMRIDTEPDEIYAGIAVITTFAAGVSGIIIAINNFRYLHNKSLVDMCLSQPMTRRQRFISDLLSGLISYIGPFIGTSIISGLLLLIGYTTMNGETILISYGNGESYASVCDFFGYFAPVFGYIVLTGIITMLLLFLLTVLVMVCCGTLFESILYTIFVNAAIPLFVLLVYAMWFSDLEGISLDDKMCAFLCTTSPVGCIVQLVYMIETLGEVHRYGYFDGVPLHIWLIGVVIVIAAMLFGSYFLYMKRKAEQVSKPFVFKGFYYILITMMTVCIASFIEYASGAEIVATFIITFIFYMILEVISRRGFRKFWHGILRYAATMLVFIGVAALVDYTNCFGIELKVPSVNSVSKVYVSYRGIDGNGTSENFHYFNGNNEKAKEALEAIQLTTPENIASVVNAHQAIVDYYCDGAESGYGSSDNLSICYVLNNGTKLVRSYNYIHHSAMEHLIDIELTEEYKIQYAGYIRKEIESFYDRYKNDFTERAVRENAITYNALTLPLEISYTNGIGGNGAYTFYPDKEFMNRLAAAMESDIINMTADEYLHSTAETEFTLHLYYDSYDIDSNYRETMALLAEKGYNLILESGHLADFFRVITKDMGYEIRIFKPGELEEFTGLPYTRVYDSSAVNTSKLWKEGIKYVRYYSDELVEILKVMKPVYISDNLCHTIEVNGKLFAIPYDYSEQAAELYSQAVTVMDNEEYSSRYYTGFAY
ncbi:MAG: hypothetical protein IJF18_07165 [Oscillospiraceae bacterium]|nr:hypothetical protein [Oscillospiraceae bacterium]